MHDNLFNYIDIKPENINIPNGEIDQKIFDLIVFPMKRKLKS